MDFGALFRHVQPHAPRHRDLRKNLYFYFLRRTFKTPQSRFQSNIWGKWGFNHKPQKLSSTVFYVDHDGGAHGAAGGEKGLQDALLDLFYLSLLTNV